MTNSEPPLLFIVFFFFLLCPNRTIQLPRSLTKTKPPSMFLLPSISTTKKFFKKTLWNFKSFFTNTYHRLPKAPPPFTAGPKMDKDSTFDHFNTSQEEVQNGSFTKNNGNNAVHFSKTIDKTQMDRVEINQQSIKIGATHQRKSQENSEPGSKRSTRLYEYDERRVYLVAKKIKELEKLDARNVDHSLDIEEILHYYSRLTCPTYLEIVDRFFMDMFAEFCSNSSSSQQNKI